MNIVTDNMPAITLGFNNSSKDIMRDKPRKNAEILTGEFLNLIILNGITMGIISLCVAYLSYNVIRFSPEVARTTILVSMILMQIANAYNFRSFRYSVFTRSLFVNKYLIFASLLSVCVTVAIIYTPLNKSFETTPLRAESWIIALCAALAITAFMDIFKLINNKSRFFLQHIH
jgi:Ca2+-transporting ATPase